VVRPLAPEYGPAVRTGPRQFYADNPPGILRGEALTTMSAMTGLGATFPGLVLFKAVCLYRYLRGWRRRTERTFGSGSSLVTQLGLQKPDLLLKVIDALLLFQTTAADFPPRSAIVAPSRSSAPINGDCALL
jgi:hypothetical protein